MVSSLLRISFSPKEVTNMSKNTDIDYLNLELQRSRAEIDALRHELSSQLEGRLDEIEQRVINRIIRDQTLQKAIGQQITSRAEPKPKVENTLVINNLEWGLDTGLECTWDEAMYYAKKLGEGWRLPTVHELFTIIDHERNEPACSVINLESVPYWTSTESANGGAWAISFFNGDVSTADCDNLYLFLCVRVRNVINIKGP